MWQKKTLLSLSLEAIDFQPNANFFKELVAVCRSLSKADAKTLADHDIAQQLPAVIKHHTGMNVQVWFGAADVAMAAPLVNHNNPLLNALDLEDREFMPNADADQILARLEKNPIGRVSLKTGMVSGIFSVFPAILTLPSEVLTSSKYSPEEKAAMILHELGHVFSYFEFLANSHSTNQILAAISRKYDQTTNVKEREYVLTKIKTLAQLDSLDAEALAQSNDKKVVSIVVVASLVKKIESELGSNLYDMNSWEQLADQYATRQGAGRHVLTVLDKMYRADEHLNFRSTPRYLFVEALKLCLVAFIPFTGGVSLMPLLAMCGVDASQPDAGYDSLKNRYGRVRDQVVEALKDQKLSSDDVENLTQDLDAIDELLKGVKDRQQLFGYLIDFLSPYQRKRISQQKMQRELERLAHNDLFTHSAKLRQLA